MFAIKDFLRTEVVPALGCTEPGAVALATARARKEIGSEEIKKIEVDVSPNIYKNGYAVGIPGVKDLKGNAVAAALGAICGKSEYGLEALKSCDKSDIEKAIQLVKAGLVTVSPNFAKNGVYVKVSIITDKRTCSCFIEDRHDNITKIMMDGKLILSKRKRLPVIQNSEKASIFDAIKNMTFNELTSLLNDIDGEDIKYIYDGIKMNMAVAHIGLDPDNDYGLGVGKTIFKMIKSDDLSALPLKIKAYAAAAADARMAGISKPVMSSAGSGNHGITAILPVCLVADFYKKSMEETAKAVTLSHLTTSFLKSRTGRLSPICGCTVAAGAGAAAGITYLLSQDMTKVEDAIEIHVSNLIGMICDGAKDTCALKVATGAYEAFTAAMIALEKNGHDIPRGIIGETLEETVDNMAELSNKGMKNVDTIIISLLQNNIL